MNFDYFLFLFLWLGMPVVWLILTILFFILSRRAKKKRLAEQTQENIKKAKVTKVFFIVFLVMFSISAILSGSLFVLLSMAAKYM